MRRKYLLGAALVLGLTATATAQKTGGTAPPKSPTTTPTTGGTAPPGTPTTGGTAPGLTPSAPPGTPTTGGTVPGTTPKLPPGTAPPTTGTAGTAIAPPTTSPFPTPLFQQAEVARSLGLSDRQTADLSRVTQTLQTRFASDFQGITRLPAAEQVARRRELERQFQQDFLTGARDIFDARQLSRYQQLQFQFGGFSTLADPVVQRQLGLTNAQVRDLQASIDWSTGQLRDINSVSATDRERAVRQYGDFQRGFQDRFNRFLTPDQRRTWTTLVGDPFAFQPYFPTGIPGVSTPGTTTTPGSTLSGGTGTPPKQ